MYLFPCVGPKSTWLPQVHLCVCDWGQTTLPYKTFSGILDPRDAFLDPNHVQEALHVWPLTICSAVFSVISSVIFLRHLLSGFQA